MEPPPHIAQLLDTLAEFNPVVSVEESAHRLRFERDTKLVAVLWPNHVGEVFFEFMKSGELLLAESVEYYENETGPEQAADVAQIVQNFLLNEVKVAESGQILKHKVLQSYRSGKWLSVFESASP
jgi:hypothetical protein